MRLIEHNNTVKNTIFNKSSIFNRILSNSHVLIFLVSTFFLTYRLGEVMFSVDTPFWYQRTENFTRAVRAGDWEKTFQNPKPGVTIMWLSGLGLETFMTLYEAVYKFRPSIYTHDTYKYVDMSATLPLITVTLISQIFFYIIVKKMTGKSYAQIALVMFVLEPLYIGISRIFHGDGTLTAFMTMAGISTIYAVHGEYKPKWFALSGIFSALAMLSKSQAVFLILFTGLILLLEIFRNISKSGVVVKLLTCFGIWAASYIVIFFIVFPAMWVKPVDTIKSIGYEMFYMGAGNRTDVPQEYIDDHFRYFRTIYRVFSPANILMFPIGAALIIYQGFKGHKRDELWRFKIYGLLYFIFYFMQMSLSIQKGERYLLPIYPFVGLMSAHAISYLWTKCLSGKIAVTTALIIVVGHLTVNTPHYTAHAEYNGSWGALAGEAASYLNSKTNATELKAVIHPRSQMFRPFFKGKSYTSHETLPYGWQADYLVVDAASDFPERYISRCTQTPEKEIKFNGRIYWLIYKCE